jgi:hypothetical protein
MSNRSIRDSVTFRQRSPCSVLSKMNFGAQGCVSSPRGRLYKIDGVSQRTVETMSSRLRVPGESQLEVDRVLIGDLHRKICLIQIYAPGLVNTVQ